MSKKPLKPSAAERTVDMFGGPPKAPSKEEIEAVPEDAVDAAKQSETIEEQSVRWRATAFHYQEVVSKNWDNSAGKEVFRISERKETPGYFFLEKFSKDVKGEAYHWTGLMFHKESLFELTNCFIRASKAIKDPGSSHS